VTDWTDPVIEAYKVDVDRTLLRENLKLTPDQRLRKLQDRLAFTLELQAAGRRARAKATSTS
jgi:hypothetical protein